MTRLFDIVLALAGIVLTSPLMVAVALAIKLSDGDAVLFRQRRIGRFGKPFFIWKFRTMVQAAETLGGQLTVGDDSRITSVGRRLRRTKLDELPQLFNVLLGEMSFVGPRPEVPRYVELYSDEQLRVLDHRPGVTDPASIRFRNESELLASAADPEQAYVTQVMPDKIRINLQYAQRRNVFTDAVVILRTIVVLFSGAPQ